MKTFRMKELNICRGILLLYSLIKSQGVKLQKQQAADLMFRILILRFTFLRQAVQKGKGSLHITEER